MKVALHRVSENGDLSEEPWATMEFSRRTRKPGDRSPKGALSLLQGTWQGKPGRPRRIVVVHDFW